MNTSHLAAESIENCAQTLRNRVAMLVAESGESGMTCAQAYDHQLQEPGINMSDPIHVISLGAGVQSSTMALMAACGELTPMPAVAVFADTGDEPSEVYEWLDLRRAVE